LPGHTCDIGLGYTNARRYQLKEVREIMGTTYNTPDTIVRDRRTKSRSLNNKINLLLSDSAK